MPRKGIAYCNRVQRLFFLFSPSIKVDQPRKATGNPFSLFTDRNQKLMPGDTGPKTNPLQLLFDRYETLLLCWQIGNATKDNCQTALASLEKGCKFHQWAPFQSLLLFFFSNSVNSLFFNMRVQTGSHYLVNEYEIIQQWLFQGLKWSLCLVVNSSPLAHFPKRLQTMKIYRREMVQVDRCSRI